MNLELANSATMYDGIPEAIFNQYNAEFIASGSYDEYVLYPSSTPHQY